MVLHKLLSWRLPAATIAVVAVLAAALMFGRAPTQSVAHTPPANVHGAVYNSSFHHDGRVSVIVQSSGNIAGAADAVRAAGGEITQQYRIIPALEATVPVDAIEGLARNSFVRQISLNSAIEPAGLGGDNDAASVAVLERQLADAQLALTRARSAVVTASVRSKADQKAAHQALSQSEKAVATVQKALDRAREQTAQGAAKAAKQAAKADRRSLFGDRTPRGAQRGNYTDLASVFPSVVGATDVWDEGVAGRGVGIAIVDTGVKRGQATDFGKLMLVDCSAVTGGRSTDEYGHGTHVAGIAAGDGTHGGERFMGIPPGANIIGVQVGQCDAGFRLGDALLGLEWVLDHRAEYNIRVANRSFTQSVPESQFVSPRDAAIEQLWFHGIVVSSRRATAATSMGTSSIIPRRTTPSSSPSVRTATTRRSPWPTTL